MPKWPTQHIRHHCGMVLKYKNLQHYKVAFSEVLKVVIVSKYSVHSRSLLIYFTDLLHGKFLMGIQLWGNMVLYQSSLMRGLYSIMRKLNLKILILVIKFFNMMKGWVILPTIVPWFKILLHYIFLFYLKKRSKI